MLFRIDKKSRQRTRMKFGRHKMQRQPIPLIGLTGWTKSMATDATTVFKARFATFDRPRLHILICYLSRTLRQQIRNQVNCLTLGQFGWQAMQQSWHAGSISQSLGIQDPIRNPVGTKSPSSCQQVGRAAIQLRHTACLMPLQSFMTIKTVKTGSQKPSSANLLSPL